MGNVRSYTKTDSTVIHCNSVAQMNCMHTILLPVPGTKIKYVSALLHSGGEKCEFVLDNGK